MSGWTLADPVPAFAPARLPAAPPVLALATSQNLAELPNPAAARINLGLGNAATRDVGTASGTLAAGDDPRFAMMADLQAQVAALKAQVAALMASMTLPSAPLPITSRFTLRNGGAVQLRNGSFVAYR